MTFYTRIVLTLLLLRPLNCLKGKSSESSCKGPYNLISPSNKPNPVNWSPYPATLWWNDENVKTLLATRSVFTKYCYGGGSLDPNTGCIHKLSDRSPSCSELRAWKALGKCSVGEQCEPNGDCWGSWSSKCLGEVKDDSSYYSQKDFSYNHEDNWIMFAHHTCVIDWQCGFKESETPYFMDWDTSSPREMILSPTHGAMYITPNFIEHGESLESKSKICLSSPTLPRRTEVRMDVHCLSTPTSKSVMCQLPDTVLPNSLRGTIVEVSKTDLRGKVRNLAILLHRLPFEVSLNPTEVPMSIEPETHPQSMSSALGKATSLESLQSVVNSIMYLQMEAHYNLMEIASGLQQSEEAITMISKHLSHQSPRLLGTIMKKPFLTKWITEDYFVACEPSQTSVLARLTDNPHLMDGNEENFLEPSSPSPHLQPYTPVNVSIFHNQTLITSDFTAPVIMVATVEEDGWAWINERRISLEEISAFSDSYGSGSGSVIQGIIDAVGNSFSVMNWINSISSFVAWIALILHFVCRR